MPRKQLLFLSMICLLRIEAFSFQDQGIGEKPSIVQLAKDKFGELTPSERNFFQSAELGEFADFTSEATVENSPASASEWNEDRILRADRIAWLCTDLNVRSLITRKGIQIKGASIRGKLDLLFAKFEFPLTFENCQFTHDIDLRRAELGGLYLTGTHVHSILGDGVKILADLNLRNGFEAHSVVRIPGAAIGGSLDCSGGTFRGDSNHSLVADKATFSGDILLSNGFRSFGEVRFQGATIAGSIYSASSHYLNEWSSALSLAGTDIDGSVLFGELFLLEGQIRLTETNIRGSLVFNGVTIKNLGPKISLLIGDATVSMAIPYAINAEGVTVGGSVTLTNAFEVDGGISLRNAKIGGHLECSLGEIRKADSSALLADGLQVGGSITMTPSFHGKGEVRMVGAVVQGDFDASGASMENPNGKAVSFDSARIGGSLNLRSGFKSNGALTLMGVVVGRRVDCSDSQFSNPGSDAINADGIRVDESFLFLEQCEIQGNLDLPYAEIRNELNLRGLTFVGDSTLDLRYANVGTFRDSEECWPGQGHLHLNGFTYQQFHDESPINPSSRIAWLNLQPRRPFLSQPYEQVATVLQKCGQWGAAREILVEKERVRGISDENMGFWGRLRFDIVHWTLGYGYHPWLVCWFILSFVILGWILFWIGHKKYILKQRSDDGKNALRFNSLFYSIDTFVPFLKRNPSPI